MMDFLRRLARDEDGPTAVEYAVMMALIIVVCLGGVGLLSAGTAASFESTSAEPSSVF